MQGHQDHGLLRPTWRDIGGPVRGIDDRVAGYEDPGARQRLALKVSFGGRGWRQEDPRQVIDQDAVLFFWKGIVEIERAQPGFYVSDGNPLVEGGKRGAQGGGGVALYDDEVLSFARQQGPKGRHHPREHLVRRLS